jgi:hypothetical protein
MTRERAEEIVKLIRGRTTRQAAEGIFTINMHMSFDDAVELILKEMNAPKVNGLYPVWWFTGSTPPNMATILEIRPYSGKLTEHYKLDLKLTAPRTKRGWLWMAAE